MNKKIKIIVFSLLVSASFNSFARPPQIILDLNGPSYKILHRLIGIMHSFVNPGLSYDCSLFDTNGVCLSLGGKSITSNENDGDTTAAVLIGAYQVNPNVRVGGFIDQRTDTLSLRGVRLDNGNPDFGFYTVWNENSNNEGLYARAALRYGNNDLSVTRTGTDGTTLGEGKSEIESYAAQVTVGRGYRLNTNWIASPYIGLRYVNISRDAYTESSGGGVSHGKFSQESYTSVLGVSLAGDVAENTRATFTVGVDHDLDSRAPDFAASGVAAVDLDDNLRKTRAVASVEVAYALNKTNQISGKVTYRQEPVDSVSTTTAFISYTKGF